MTKSKHKQTFKSVKRPITRLEFASFHFKQETTESDIFYTKLANRIYETLNSCFKNDPYITFQYTRRAALMLAAYVEDVVAGNNVFKAFMSLHKKKYGKKLPFYDTENDENFNEEFPSLSTVRFLLWYVLNDANPNTIINPLNEALEMLAAKILVEIYSVLDDVPDSLVRPEILPEEVCGVPEIFQIREMCLWLITGCYLTRIWDMEDITNELSYYIEAAFSHNKELDDNQLLYAAYSYLPYNILIGPLAITAQEWLAEIIALAPETYEKKYIKILQEFKSQPFDFYQYKQINKKSATLLSRSGNELKFSAFTMPGEVLAPEIKKGDTAFMSMIYYDGMWMISGMSIASMPAEVFDKAAQEYSEKQDNNKRSYDYNLRHLNNKRIGVFANYDEYISRFPEQKDVPMQNNTDIQIKDLNNVDSLLYFIHTDGAVSLIPDIANAIKIKGNKYYDKEIAPRAGVGIILTDEVADRELRRYLIDNNLVPDAAVNSTQSPAAGNRLFQGNIQFLFAYTNRNTLILSAHPL